MNNMGQLPVSAFTSRCQCCWRDGLLEEEGRCGLIISPVHRQMELVAQTSTDRPSLLDNIKNKEHFVQMEEKIPMLSSILESLPAFNVLICC